MNFYVVPFKVIPLGYNTLVPAFFPILEALVICTLWYILKRRLNTDILTSKFSDHFSDKRLNGIQ